MSDKLFKKLISFEQEKDSVQLQEFVENLDTTKLISLVTDRIVKPDGARALQYLLFGLSQKNSSQKKRVLLIDAVLKEIQKRTKLSNVNQFKLVFQIAIELEKFSNPHLIKICNLCIDFIRDSADDSPTSWKELLPKLLSVLVTRKDIDLDGTEMTGIEYKKRIVQNICMLEWKPSIITTLTAMFTELHLSGDQLCEVVNKLCRSIEELSADEIPPFIHQLLELCRECHANYVFLALRNYFHNNIYCSIHVGKSHNNDSDDEIMENEDDSIKNCECTVLYHIEEAAKLGHNSISQFLRFAKSAVNCPEFLLHPFFLAILFILSSISTYEDQLGGNAQDTERLCNSHKTCVLLLDGEGDVMARPKGYPADIKLSVVIQFVITLLKNIFIRNCSEDEKKQESAWLRTVIPKNCNMQESILKLIKSRACENDKVMKGLINLSVSFLALSKRSGTQNPEYLWKLGRVILVSLVQKHKQVADAVLKKLVDSIFGGQNIAQYTDCLRGLCDVATFTVTDKLSHLTRLVELLVLIPGEDAEDIIFAIIPIVRVSSRLRDSLISALRKALFHKDKKTKEMAVAGFLKLLRYLNVKKLTNLSQGSSFNDYSGPSVFSQISAEVHLSQTANQISSNSNEAICLEVVNILKRCFAQSAEVRVCLYEGLFDVIEHNSVLGSNVLELLLNHFVFYYKSDQSELPPLDFSKAVIIQGRDAVLQEPLGHLLLIIQQIVIKIKNEPENDIDESYSYAEKFSNILTSLTNRMIRCDLNHFELDEETNILDILPESLQKQQILYQTIAVYEALMAYSALSWNLESTNQQGRTLELLFKGYNLFYDYIKNSKSSKKKDGGPKKDKADGKRIAVPTFKPPETILHLYDINRILSLLVCDALDWATPESTADIRSRRPILRYALQAASEAVHHVSKRQSKGPKILKDCFQLGRLLNTRCLSNYEKFKEFDLMSAVFAIECFSELVSFITSQHKSKFPQFLEEIDNISQSAKLTSQLKPVVTKLQSLLDDVVNDTDTIEVYLKREAMAVVNCFACINLQLPVDESYSRLVADYLLEFAQIKTLPFAAVTKTYMSHMLTMLLRCKTEVACLDNMALQICSIIGTHDDRDLEECQLNLSMLNESSVFNALPMLCNTLINMLENIKWLLARLRSEISVSNCYISSSKSPADKKKLREKRESELVRHAGLCVNIAQTIVTIGVPAGPCTDVVFSMLSRIFTTLTDITKYFTAYSDQHNRIYQDARFGKVVKLASFHLSSEIPDFILHVEQSLRTKNGNEKHEKVVQNSRKQAQYIPKLTGDLENFTKCVSLLSNKCKDPQLAANLKLTTTRDFRVNLKKVDEIMTRNNAVEEADEEEIAEDNPATPEPPRKKSKKK